MADKGCKAHLLGYARAGLEKVKIERSEHPADAKRCGKDLDKAVEKWREAKRNLRKGPCGPAVENIFEGYFHWQEYEDCTRK